MKRALAVLAVTTVAHADPPKLRLEREPAPRTLRMRPKHVAQTSSPPPAAKRIPMPAAPAVSATSPDPIDGIDGIRDVRQPVSFSVALGYQVDGARPSNRAGLGSPAPVVGQDYATLRSYGFGEAFLSTRGLGFDSLETYFAVRFQAARKLLTDEDLGEPREVVPAPIATWFARSGTELRTGWAELKDFLPKRLGLSKLRVRAGDQFVYGPWILHMDGLYATYEGPALTVALYGGPRHSDYTREQTEKRPLAGGASLRFDLRGLQDKVPIAVAGEIMTLSKSDETGEASVDTSLIQADWRPRRDVAVIAQVRGVNGAMANQRVEVRTRYKQVTNFVFDVMRRFQADWRWDPSLVSRPTEDITEARRYLDLGPVVPQLIASARAGTLIRENIDLLGRIAYATDLLEDGEPVNTFSRPYLELAGALEVRLRRQAAVGFSVLSRRIAQPDVPAQPILDEHGPINALPSDSDVGEDGFLELGTTLKMTLGARRFSAMVEGYARRTRYSVLYRDPIAPLPDTELHGGGRFTVDAWVSPKVRIFASYDVSTVLDTAPDINGYKSLRLVLSGVY
ncbi:MAG TPA: hypothetical protein VFQ53_21435 [Kofleriaceae bacterium]|nr:hypothetical protein [Kofleriaceae bacterium]